ncbi:mannitol-1-phosphate 5-dehydrogenase [Microbacterium sp.]|uniref:mannitol-1-phosphate 5-dehydrogenase n=1 Tax=Microbacterium sp. TaxID=51671 RepID=UPI0025EFC502|nr:mannitol-1-phosphate 5-dehydrogenase [Microbacterium sp.]
MKAVHFGAGNIGRGFVGLLLHEGGYELVFSDVAAPLVDAINGVSEYTVHEVGEGGERQQAGGVGRSPIESRDTVVTGFRAINSATHPDEVIEQIAGANVVTTAVGPTVLKFVAPHIVAGLALRDPSSPPLQVMACENAINATDVLRDEIVALAGVAWDALAGRAVFANTAVDRIVPAQPEGGGVDVTVEPFYEWAIERPPFGEDPPNIPGAHFVDDLAPYIERKLFTVNTGHAATAYFGAVAGIETISGALSDAGIANRVGAALEETSALLVAKHGLDPADLATYRATILRRFRNPALPDTVWRVGRQPLRKLSRHERFVGPAAEAAERGLSVDALVAAMGAALAFDDSEDAESVDLQRMLRDRDAASVTASVTGLEHDHPLFPRIEAIVAARQAELA